MGSGIAYDGEISEFDLTNFVENSEDVITTHATLVVTLASEVDKISFLKAFFCKREVPVCGQLTVAFLDVSG